MKRLAFTVMLLSAAAQAHGVPRFLEARAGETPPNGYQEATRPRIALVVTSASLFVVGWSLAAGGGFSFFCTFERPACEGSPAVGLIPVVGGALMSNQHYLPAWAGALTTLGQSIGVLLAVVGLASPERVWMLREMTFRLTPTGVVGTF